MLRLDELSIDHEKRNDFLERTRIEAVDKQKKSFQHPKWKFWSKPKPIPSEFQEAWEIGHPYTGTIAGQYSYAVTPTSISEIVTIHCAITGDEEDITNYEIW